MTFTGEQIERMAKFIEDSQKWKCPVCGESPEIASGRWRHAGSCWEHHHGYPVGHVAAEYQPIGKPNC